MEKLLELIEGIEDLDRPANAVAGLVGKVLPAGAGVAKDAPSGTRLSIRGAPVEAEPRDAPAWDRGDHLRRRAVSPEQWRRYERYMGEILSAFGMDLATPGTVRTPERFLRALYDSTAGYEGDDKLLTTFPTEASREPGDLDGLEVPEHRLSQVIEGPISFFSLCEHHALPFFGVAHVGYVAGEQIIGISKLTRIVRMFARRFTVQERIGEEVADLLMELLEPQGVAVSLHAVHLCTQMRGVSEERSRTWTSFWRGSYEADPNLRGEFLQISRLASS